MKFKIEELRKYIEENPEYTITETAKHFGVSRPTIRKYLASTNISRKNGERANLDEKELRDFILNNPKSTQKEIAKHFNVSATTINRLIKKWGIRKTDMRIKGSKLTKEQIEEYLKVNPSATLKQMSKDLGVCMTTLFITLEKYGIKRKEKAKTESKKESSKLPKDNQKIILKVIELRRNKPNIPLSKILVVLKSKGISLTENEVLDYEKTMKRDSQEER